LNERHRQVSFSSQDACCQSSVHLQQPPQAGSGDAPTDAIEDKPAVALTPEAVSNGAPTTLADLEKQHILSTLKHCEDNRTRTAETLDINIRTLRNKLNEYKEQGEPVD
jgi:DNA-binding NtrC family response regulator